MGRMKSGLHDSPDFTDSDDRESEETSPIWRGTPATNVSDYASQKCPVMTEASDRSRIFQMM